MQLLTSNLLGLAGPGQKISAFAAVTVIARRTSPSSSWTSSADPQWRGSRVAALKKFPDNLELWQQYGDLRRSEQAAGKNEPVEARSFYLAHRAETWTPAPR